MRLAAICGALAVGEFTASYAPEFAAAWPFAGILAAVAALVGYGLAWRWLCCAAVMLLGVALFLFGSQEQEVQYRMSPWLREAGRSQWQCREEQAGVTMTVKDDLARRIGIGLEHDQESASLVRAILLGERKHLPRQTRQLFVESGTMHVFAISGLHVMAIAEVLSFLLAFLMVPARLSGLASVPLLWGYVAMIGFAPSAVRAAMMATITGIAPVFWRRASGLRAWELTFLIVHISNPLMITNVGNVLSFAVMLAIVIAGDFMKAAAKWRQHLFVTLAAWAAGVPVMAHVFGRVTPGGMLANLVLIGTAKATVVSGMLGIMASYVSETLAAHVNNLGAIGIRAMVLVAEGVSRMPGANIETVPWTILTCVEWYAAFALTGFLLKIVTERRRAMG